MTKGTTSFGPRNNKTHNQCRRCGRKTFHNQHKRCAACGYPDSKTRRYDGWGYKVRGRKGQGTGRMQYLKTIKRKFFNGFREENVLHLNNPELKRTRKTGEKQVLKRSKVNRRTPK